MGDGLGLDRQGRPLGHVAGDDVTRADALGGLGATVIDRDEPALDPSLRRGPR